MWVLRDEIHETNHYLSKPTNIKGLYAMQFIWLVILLQHLICQFNLVKVYVIPFQFNGRKTYSEMEINEVRLDWTMLMTQLIITHA